MKKENIYMTIWKGSFLFGNLLLILSILSGWAAGYGIAGVLIFIIPYICMMNTNVESEKDKYSKYSMECEKSEESIQKIKALLEQFEDEKE